MHAESWKSKSAREPTTAVHRGIEAPISDPEYANANRRKGRILEDVVALLHEGTDAKVETRVKLPSTHGSSRRKREIDVLLTGHLSGHPIRVAIECKNYGEYDPVGVELIGSFRDKLEDVGIPVSQGIYVSVHGFTSGALERAAELGMRTLILTGLTPDRLDQEIRSAIQSTIFLLATIEKVTIQSGVPSLEGTVEFTLWSFVDRDGRACGMIPDLIWYEWSKGDIPSTLGRHEIEIQLPSGWYWQVEGIGHRNSATAVVYVAGLVISSTGEARMLQLSDATTGQLERAHIAATFETESKSYPVKVVETEDQLEELLSEPATARLTMGRVPLPRVRWNMMFWPPSDQTLRRLFWHWHLLVRNGHDLSDLSKLSLLQIEGSDLNAIWDPISETHPVASVEDWPHLPPIA